MQKITGISPKWWKIDEICLTLSWLCEKEYWDTYLLACLLTIKQKKKNQTKNALKKKKKKIIRPTEKNCARYFVFYFKVLVNLHKLKIVGLFYVSLNEPPNNAVRGVICTFFILKKHGYHYSFQVRSLSYFN